MAGLPTIPYRQHMNACETKSPIIRTTLPTTQGAVWIHPRTCQRPLHSLPAALPRFS